jgi:hypothetical protein
VSCFNYRLFLGTGYPFAMVFVVVRTLIDRMGLVGLETVVWSAIATAGFLPSFLIAWHQLREGQPAAKVRPLKAA